MRKLASVTLYELTKLTKILYSDDMQWSCLVAAEDVKFTAQFRTWLCSDIERDDIPARWRLAMKGLGNCVTTKIMCN